MKKVTVLIPRYNEDVYAKRRERARESRLRKRLSTLFGFLVPMAAFLYMLFILVRTIFYGDPVPGFPTLVILILFLVAFSCSRSGSSASTWRASSTKRKTVRSMWCGRRVRSRKNSWFVALTLLLIGVAMWLLNYLTPEYADDHWYKFIYLGGKSKSFVPIPVTSFWDVLVSQYYHYLEVNGRTLVHIFVQLFTGLWGKTFFNVCNAAVFVIFIWLLTRLTAKVTVRNLLFSGAVVVLLYPAFHETILWMTGSINYLWPSTAVCAVLLAVDRLKEKPWRNVHIGWGVLCCFVGWSQEGIMLPLAASLAVYAIINRKWIVKSAAFPLIVGFVLGALMCTLAPSTLARTEAYSDYTFAGMASRILVGVRLTVRIKVLYGLIAVLMIALWLKSPAGRYAWLAAFYKEQVVVCNALIFSLGILFLSGFCYQRVTAITAVYAIMLLLTLLKQFDAKYVTAIKTVVCIGVGILYGCILPYAVRNHRAYEQIIAQLKDVRKSVIVCPDVQIPRGLTGYVLRAVAADCFGEDNFFTAIYSHNEPVRFVSETIYLDMKNDSDRLRNVACQGSYPYYVVPLSADEDPEPVFVLHPTDFDALPCYVRPFAHKLDRYTKNEIPAYKFGTNEIDGRKYLFICKHPLIDHRLKEISLR